MQSPVARANFLILAVPPCKSSSSAFFFAGCRHPCQFGPTCFANQRAHQFANFLTSLPIKRNASWCSKLTSSSRACRFYQNGCAYYLAFCLQLLCGSNLEIVIIDDVGALPQFSQRIRLMVWCLFKWQEFNFRTMAFNGATRCDKMGRCSNWAFCHSFWR